MKSFLSFVFVIISLGAVAQSNNSLYFDSDASVTGLSGISPGQFTVEFWLLLDYAGNQYQGVYWSANGSDERGIYVENDNTISLWDQNIAQYNSSTALPLNQWVHVAFSYDGSQLKIYINASLVNTLTVSGLQIPSTNVTMGYSSAGLYGDYNMANSALDEFRIWNVAKTQGEIQANKDIQLTLPQAGLVRYYDFNQGVGGGDNTGVTTLPDITGNSAGGTLAGFTLMGNTSNWISNNPLLPLTLLSFDGYVSGSSIRLNWGTTGEINVQKFEIEKSTSEGEAFQKAGEVAAQNRTSATNAYEWTDYSPSLAASNLYRLKMTDKDGKFTYSKVINVRTGAAAAAFKIYYLNPGNRTFGLQMPQAAPAGKYHLSIYTIGGRQVQQQELDYDSYSNIYRFGINSPAAAPGIYTVVLNKGNYVLSKSLIIQ